MKFYGIVINRDLKDNNGGSLVIDHHLHALEELGHQTGLLSLYQVIPEDADFVIFQSEWTRAIAHLKNTKAKKICWLGHFKPDSKFLMPDIQTINADYYITQWKGECVQWAEQQLGKKIHYLPHNGCLCNLNGENIEAPRVLFIGTDHSERKKDWLDYSEVTRIACPHEQAKNYYRSAIACPNLHGDFQKNIVTEFQGIPGEMINDRIFNTILAGGFAISDNTPIVKEFFSEDEVPYAKDKEHFKWMIDYFSANPDERIPYMEKSKARILREHLYTHKWEEYLKTL